MSLQLSTKDFYQKFASHAVPTDVHGILRRMASLRDTPKDWYHLSHPPKPHWFF